MVTKIQFSQANLQDFQDCKRRFFLRHIRKLAWPAVESHPMRENEILREHGVAFHRMAQQYFLGIPESNLNKLNTDEPLHGWWQNFIESKPSFSAVENPDARIFPEFTLNTILDGHRLTAKFDLLVVLDAKIIIYDWKTSRRRPDIKWLDRKLQTRVYPFVVAKSGAYLLRGRQTLLPENVQLVYWFADFPNQPEIISYSKEKMDADSHFVSNIIAEIAGLDSTDEEVFNRTSQDKICSFCVYRSLCRKGISAGVENEMEDMLDLEPFSMDLDQIAEVGF